MTETTKKILESLEPLFKRATKEKKWFHCYYQSIQLSPKELRENNEKGLFIWGPVNWSLIDPPKLCDPQEVYDNCVLSNSILKKRIDEGFK